MNRGNIRFSIPLKTQMTYTPRTPRHHRYMDKTRGKLCLHIKMSKTVFSLVFTCCCQMSCHKLAKSVLTRSTAAWGRAPPSGQREQTQRTEETVTAF